MQVRQLQAGRRHFQLFDPGKAGFLFEKALVNKSRVRRLISVNQFGVVNNIGDISSH